MPIPVIVVVAIIGAIVGIGVLVALIGPVFRGIGWVVRGIFWFIAHVFRFVFSTVADTLRVVGAVIAAIVLVPFVLLNVVIARWSAAAHYGRSLQRELGAAGAAVYRLAIGNPARLLLLDAVTEGIERRIPEAIAQAPGPDKPGKATGTFPGYKVVGSLKAGGSGGRLFVAEPLAEKKAALARAGVPSVDQVVIKAFSVKDGATLDQIVRESRALEAARRLHLILDHELTGERFYYVTPYVPGENLSIVTQQLHAKAGDGGLRGDTLRDALGYTKDLLKTLDRYHGAGLWHKDIKPDNIIVHAGRAHLVDLGLVTPLASAMTLTTHGTEYFRDPEMVRMALRGVKVHEVDGVKFDIYGVGAVIYSVVENSFPAHGGLSQISKGCPEALRWIIRRSMTDLVHRYPTSAAMLADVEHLSRSADPYAVKPAQLPSMREGDVDEAAVAATPEPEFAAMPASFATPPRATPRPANPGPSPRFQGAPVGAGAPGGAGASRPRVRVLDWWTGKYAVDVAEGAVRIVRANKDVIRESIATAFEETNRMRGARRSAREQLASARARVANRQRSARARFGARRHERFQAGPNFGVGIAIAVLFTFVAYQVLKPEISRMRGQTATGGAAAGFAGGDELEFPMRVVTPRGTWELECSGGEDMLVVDEEQPIMHVTATDTDGEDYEFDAAPSAFFPRLIAGPMGTGRVAVLWDRASLGSDSVATLHEIADILEDGGATLVGYKDRRDDLDAAARMRSILGVSTVDDPMVRNAMIGWLRDQQCGSMVIVGSDRTWVVLDVDGSGIRDAMANPTSVPPPMRAGATAS